MVRIQDSGIGRRRVLSNAERVVEQPRWREEMKKELETMIQEAHLRVARPTDRLDEVFRFYRDGLGLMELGSFTDHAGFDGIMLGHPDQAYHFEFTRQGGHQVGRATTQENLLVFYIPDTEQWSRAIEQMRDAGYEPVSSHNPYWEARGRTFEDPDGYRVVLQNAAWSE